VTAAEFRTEELLRTLGKVEKRVLWLSTAIPLTTLGVSRFGQSGALHDVYRYHHFDTDGVAQAALDLID
jgi:pyruvate dehydrogenase complex dehydrogenase (E1) component